MYEEIGTDRIAYQKKGGALKRTVTRYLSIYYKGYIVYYKKQTDKKEQGRYKFGPETKIVIFFQQNMAQLMVMSLI